MKKIILILSILAMLSTFTAAQKTPKADYRKKIDEATPKALPQTPVAEKLKSDAQDENLKGKVKSVVVDEQETGAKRERSEESNFNGQGNLIKRVLYSGGRPFQVTVFGYLDGDRVSNEGNIEDENDPPKIIAAVRNSGDTPAKERDMRYHFKLKYRYDAQGRLAEEWWYLNDGDLWLRYVYNFKGNEKETVAYEQNGSVNWRSVEILDKNGNVIEETQYDNENEISSRSTHTYVLDKQGNWITQKRFDKEIVKGKIVLKPSLTSYRTITYYP
jgi:hypothetical protein